MPETFCDGVVLSLIILTRKQSKVTLIAPQAMELFRLAVTRQAMNKARTATAQVDVQTAQVRRGRVIIRLAHQLDV